jgi:SH3-like domain-containing protein
MYRIFCSLFGLSMLFLLNMPIISAQDSTCASDVESILMTVRDACDSVQRNQVCFGNHRIDAQAKEQDYELEFESSGDIEELSNFNRLQLRQSDPETGDWGVVLMKLQASLPGTVPGQSVTIVAFGDVEIGEQASEIPTPITVDIEVAAQGSVNLRSGPGTNYNIVDTLLPQEIVTSDGRNESTDWLRIQLSESEVAWVYAPLVKTDDDLTSLPVLTPDDSTIMSNTQAIYLNTGIGTVRCNAVPDSGILVQTPTDIQFVQFSINGIDVELGSTAYIQAGEINGLSIFLLEGKAQMTAFDETQPIFPGGVVTVNLNSDLEPQSIPTRFRPYEIEQLQGIENLVTLLPEEVTIPEPFTEVIVGYPSGCRIGNGAEISPLSLKSNTPILLHVGQGWRNRDERNRAITQHQMQVDGTTIDPSYREIGDLASSGLINYYYVGVFEDGSHSIVFNDRGEIRPCEIIVGG